MTWFEHRFQKNSPTFTPTTCRRQARGGQPPHDSPTGLFRLLWPSRLVCGILFMSTALQCRTTFN
nr:MAG TPA: hypothetical protein [Bacteriophage sp.]